MKRNKLVKRKENGPSSSENLTVNLMQRYVEYQSIINGPAKTPKNERDDILATQRDGHCDECDVNGIKPQYL